MKVCPLCERPAPEYWPNGDMVLDREDINKTRLWGLSLTELKRALDWAMAHGWTVKR